jgi:hypothetical protein
VSIIFNPVGILNISADPSDISDGDMQRCKNLRMDDMGVLKERHGSYRLNSITLTGTPDFIIEQGGRRYVFAGEYIYRNETQIAEGVSVEAPEFSPTAGEYAAAQSVTITSDTVGAKIYYTLDGTTPSVASNLYESAVTVALYTTLKAIAIRDGFDDSTVTSGYYSSTTPGTFVTETDADTFQTETDSDTFITEGAA